MALVRGRTDTQVSPTPLSPEEVATIKAEERAHDEALVKDLDAFAERERDDLDELTAMLSSAHEPSPTKDEDDDHWDERQRKYLAHAKATVESQPPVAAETFQTYRMAVVPGTPETARVQRAAAAPRDTGTWGELELQLNDRERRILIDVLGASEPKDLTFVTEIQVRSRQHVDI